MSKASKGCFDDVVRHKKSDCKVRREEWRNVKRWISDLLKAE